MKKKIAFIAFLISIAITVSAFKTVTINNTSYYVPETSDENWGDYATELLEALALYTFQNSGGSFALSADADFGTTYGFVIGHVDSNNTQVATTGFVRLANNKEICWLNAAGTGNVCLDVSSDRIRIDDVNVCTISSTDTLSNKTLTQPIITDFSAATHDHSSATNGGTVSHLNLSNIGSSTHAQIDSSIAVLDAHVNATSAHGVTSAIVGTNDTQTFMGKTYDLENNTLKSTGSTTSHVLTVGAGGVISPAAVPSAPDQSYEISNLAIAGSVAGTSMTIDLKTKDGGDPDAADKVRIGFRNSTADTGTYNTCEITSAKSLVVPGGATLGTLASASQYLYLYMANSDNACSTNEIAISTNDLDETELQNTSAIAGSSDVFGTLYSTNELTNAAIRKIGKFKTSETTAGTWLNGPSVIFPGVSGYYRNDRTISFCLSGNSGNCTTAWDSAGYANNQTISEDISNLGLSAPNRAGTGDYSVVVKTGLCSLAPNCTCSEVTNGRFNCNVTASSTTSLSFGIRNTEATAAADGAIFVTCTCRK